MNLLILFNADWSAVLTVTKNTNGWARSKSIKSDDLPSDKQAVLASKIDLFRGANEPWQAKQVNATEIFLLVDGAISQDTVPRTVRAIELNAYVVNPETGETRWLTSKDKPEFILTDKESLDFFDYLKTF